jgi:thiol:disulfide interchange protein
MRFGRHSKSTKPIAVSHLRRRHALAQIATLALALLAASSAAQAVTSEAATEQVRARLLSEFSAVHPGQTLTVGVQQHIIPHWHTYWKNSGDSGLPTTIQWQLPPGATAGEIQWPIPSRYKIGPITNYGYENEVTLLTDIAVPDAAKIGERFPIHATVDWLVCEEECIPQQVQLAIELPIVAAGTTPRDAQGGEWIAKARARLPVESPWTFNVDYLPDAVELRIANAGLHAQSIKDVWFYASQWGHTVHSAEQSQRVEGDALVIRMQSGEAPASAATPLQGVLVISEQSGDSVLTRGFEITTPTITAPAVLTSDVALSLPYALLFAFLGGLILNLMPCVFPVLSIKALSLLDHAQHSQVQAKLQGVAYTVGVLASFIALGVVLLALRAGGAQIGWGFQFQSPLFVLLVAYLMFAVGLSLSGVFYVGGSIAGVGGSLAARSGYSGSFFTGVLAVIVATPCTAPFMGAALGYALAQPAVSLLAVFISLGLGLATPYLAISMWPNLQRRLPKPGAWMERVKQAFAFPMYATAVWLLWVLAQQAGPDAVAVALSGMVAIAFAAWLYTSSRNAKSVSRNLSSTLAAAAVVAAMIGGYAGIREQSAAPMQAAVNTERGWEPYSSSRLQSLQAQGAPVFLNMTAAWCITCLVNERVALSDASVQDAFKQSEIVYLKGDWTQRDAAITSLLNQFGRSGVPLYVFYPKGAGSEPIVLPQILTPEIVLSTINPS